jgi:hypothetical protein
MNDKNTPLIPPLGVDETAPLIFTSKTYAEALSTPRILYRLIVIANIKLMLLRKMYAF